MNRPLAVVLVLGCCTAVGGKRSPPSSESPAPAKPVPAKPGPAVAITSVAEAMARLAAVGRAASASHLRRGIA